MELTVRDAIVLVYNYAVVLSGWVLVTQLGIEERIPLLGISILVALAWTIYFRLDMQPRFIGEAEESTPTE